MKRGMIFVTALALTAALLFSGCGEMRGTDGNALPPTATPAQTMLPETMMPDPEDGVVRDRDGIITDDDNASGSSRLPESSAKPNAGTGKSENQTFEKKPSALN